MYAGSGASAQQRRNPLVAAGWLDDYTCQAAIGSWNLLIRLHQSSPVGWLRNAAKSTLSILSLHLPRPKRLKMSNVLLLAKTNKNWILLIVLFSSCFIPDEPHNPFGWCDTSVSCSVFVFIWLKQKKKNIFFFRFLEQIQTPEGAHLLCPVGVKRTFKKKKMQEEIAIEIQGGRVADRPVWVVGWTTNYVQSSLYISRDIL